MSAEAFQPSTALAGKVVVVAGDRDGLAGEIADRAVASGAAGVAGLGAWCAVSGPRISRHSIDLRDEAALAAALAEIKASFGRLDVLFNCVAETPSPAGDFTSLGGEAFNIAFTEPLSGAFLVLKHAIPPMAAGGGGAIVNVVDGAPSAAQPFEFAAAATALEGMSKTAALECGPLDIRVNCVRPGGPDDAGQANPAAANLAIFLASPGASFITGAIFAFETGTGR